MEVSPGPRLAQLLVDGFESMVAVVVDELGRRGHPGVTATHEFALHAVDHGADNASELGRQLGVSKQAAAKSIAALEQLGYVERKSDPDDARRKRLHVTPRGDEMTAIGAETFDRLRAAWVDRVGPDVAAQVEEGTAELIALCRGGSAASEERPT